MKVTGYLVAAKTFLLSTCKGYENKLLRIHYILEYIQRVGWLQDINVRCPVDEVTQKEGEGEEFPRDAVNVVEVVQSAPVQVTSLQPLVPVTETRASLQSVLQ